MSGRADSGRGERARAVTGDQHVRRGEEIVEGREVGAQVEQRGAFALAGIGELPVDLGQLRWVDAEHVGAEQGQRSGGDRACEDTGEVQDANAGQRSLDGRRSGGGAESIDRVPIE